MKRQRKWLITGGAGYVGSHTADLFLLNGIEIVILDSQNRSNAKRIEYLRGKHKSKVSFVNVDIRDAKLVERVLEECNLSGVIHTAALKSVGESFQKRQEYFDVNVAATKNILELCSKFRINKFIFSSSAAVYGSPSHALPVKENNKLQPISPYGETKLLAEKAVSSFLLQPGNLGTSLRFFNIVGSTNHALLDTSVDNLVPIIMKRMDQGLPPLIFGTDYPTHDGTCIRDYVDVRDIAEAHLLVANFGEELPHALNVGTGQGVSVREVIDSVLKVFGSKQVSAIDAPRRMGDSGSLQADTRLIQSVLNFKARYSLMESLNDLMKARQES